MSATGGTPQCSVPDKTLHSWTSFSSLTPEDVGSLGADGSEREWGRVLECKPPSQLIIDWHPHGVSMRMQVTFIASAPRRTDMKTVLSGFEGFGADSVKMREIHDSKWASLLDGFVAFVAMQDAQESRQKDKHNVLL